MLQLAKLYWPYSEENRNVNFGDLLQLFSMDRLLSKRLCDLKQVNLHIEDISRYRGEKLVLPLNWNLFDPCYMKGDYIDISRDISPVYIAMTIESSSFKKEYINKNNMAYLKRFEPIGCRDRRTQSMLKTWGINAYLNGCLTATLEYTGVKGNKVILVDVPSEVAPYFPRWSGDVEVCTQQKIFQKEESVDNIREWVRNCYKYYLTEARLVVTSRLHVALPCMAAGIPVILTKNIIDARFDWLKLYLPLYDQNSYQSIDWNPQSIRYEKNKKKVIDYSAKRILNALNGEIVDESFADIESIWGKDNTVYPSFQSTVHGDISRVSSFLNMRFASEDCFCYAIWGVGQAAETVYRYVRTNYPNARLIAVVDRFKSGFFHGIPIVNDQDYSRTCNEVMIVPPVQASTVAPLVLKSKGFAEDDFICNHTPFYSF